MSDMHRLALIVPDSLAPCLFIEGSIMQIDAGVPMDAHLIAAYYDWQRRHWALLYEHPDFPEIPEGGEVPIRVCRVTILEMPGSMLDETQAR